ncbi:hypothetical protein CEXT_426001 [Caerostris extrusa]|uniref:Uncharacterized protein n=1 Tax=Caerostris extrusa TaxID=172846 RepID=A0AAV4NZT5_CAEEX|nr:hypothetical protein CEXT_426001 [Caerostris extrusa]
MHARQGDIFFDEINDPRHLEEEEEAPNDVPRRSGGFLRMGTSSSRNGLLRRARASARPNRFLRAHWSLGLLT